MTLRLRGDGMAALGTFAAVLAVGACGGQSIKQEAEPVTVTQTVTVGAAKDTSTAEAETTTEESDSGQAGIGDTITLHGYEEGEECRSWSRG